MDFSEYQAKALETDQTKNAPPEHAQLVPLLGLAGEAGQLLSEFKKRLRDGPSHIRFVDRMSEELGDILWYVANAASKFGLSLDAIANQNLLKTQGLYSSITKPAQLDASFKDGEKFPRSFVLSFDEYKDAGKVEVRTSFDGVMIGAVLTDNAYEDDGYRFHDVFHAGYVAALGWSPVLRKITNRKRRSDPRVDEVEDGGRAAVIEEGIAALVFDYARQHNFLDGIIDIDEELLRTIRGMSRHLEVATQPDTLWRRAILQGFSAWREIVKNGGGKIRVDLDTQSLTYLGPAEKPNATAPAVDSV